MKTLLEQLKPKYREKIENHEYDGIARSVLNELKEHKVAIYLSYSTVLNLWMLLPHLKSHSTQNILDLVNLFED